MRTRGRIIRFIAVVQTVLFLTHFLLYQTWMFSNGNKTSARWMGLALGLLSVSFVTASLAAFRYTNPALRAFYRAAAVWLGLVSFLFVAAVASWGIYGIASLAGVPINFHGLVQWMFGAAFIAGLAGVIN